MIFHSHKCQISILSCNAERTTFNTVWTAEPFERSHPARFIKCNNSRLVHL